MNIDSTAQGQTKKKKKNKNKNTQQQSNNSTQHQHHEGCSHDHEHGHSEHDENIQDTQTNTIKTSREDNIFSKLKKMTNTQEFIPDFKEFNQCQELIENEMLAISNIVSKVAEDNFENIPDEVQNQSDQEKTEQKSGEQQQQQQEAPKKGKKGVNDPQKTRKQKALNDLTEKIDYLKQKLATLEKNSLEYPEGNKIKALFNDVKDNLLDDIKRNNELYRLIEASDLQ